MAHSERVLAAVDRAGSPRGTEEYRRVGALLSGLRTAGRHYKYLPSGADPMIGVAYNVSPRQVQRRPDQRAEKFANVRPVTDAEIPGDEAVITGLADDRPLRPGRSATVLGHRLGTEGAPLVVLVGAQPVTATPGDQRESITFTVPDPLPQGDSQTVAVTVKSGAATATQELPVEQPRVRSAWRTHDGAVAVAATGWHSGDPANDPPPQILVDGRPAAVRDGFRDNPAGPLVADLPAGTDPAAEARIAVIDDLGRRSQDHLLAAQPA